MLLGLAFLAFTIVVGLCAVGTGISFATRPAETKLALLRPLCLAVILAAASSIAVGLATTFSVAAAGWGTDRATPAMLFAGLAEAMVVPAAGLALAAIAWLFVAVGMRRQP